MKRISSAVLIFSVLLMCIWWWHHYHQGRKPFRCDTQQISILLKTHNNISLNANSTIVFSSSKTGIVYITGSIKENDTRYLLDRKIFFTITPSELKGANNTQITHEEVHPVDTTPDNVWRNIIMPEVKNVDFYTEITPLFHNAMLIRGLTNPFLVCTRQD
ncbi:hypothetical protein [Serratia fonticola]|uniref:hypothetical protein n=1 Tax=Serratia fonticola TaxID=47917 RepID=UPI002DB95347|nr:hypothetical protein [Serratia fonticola]MEB7884167.1 hypothetical protein [Serratia fonticola]